METDRVWKIEPCKLGECKNERKAHIALTPTSTAEGLITVCSECKKTRRINFKIRNPYDKTQPDSNYDPEINTEWR